MSQLHAQPVSDGMETDDESCGDSVVAQRAQAFVDHLDDFIKSIDELNPEEARASAHLHRVTANLVIHALSDLLLRLDGLDPSQPLTPPRNLP